MRNTRYVEDIDPPSVVSGSKPLDSSRYTSYLEFAIFAININSSFRTYFPRLWRDGALTQSRSEAREV